MSLRGKPTVLALVSHKAYWQTFEPLLRRFNLNACHQVASMELRTPHDWPAIGKHSVVLLDCDSAVDLTSQDMQQMIHSVTAATEYPTALISRTRLSIRENGDLRVFSDADEAVAWLASKL